MRGAMRGAMRAVPAVIRIAAAVAGVSAVAAPARAEAPAIPAHASWTQLSWSNGVGAGFFDTATRRVRGFRDHLYASGATELMYDAYFGLRVAGQDTWLTARPVEQAGYD